MTDDELKSYYEEFSYKGFNRKDVLKELKRAVPDLKTSIQIIIVCALSGPKRAARTKLLDGKTIENHGIPASGAKGTKNISCQRITAATADLAAFYLKKLNVPKRIMVDCPAWLQFPSAGSITLPEHLRNQHYDFSKRFSQLIGGVFNEQIYMTMINNSYLNPKLNLFDGLIPQPQSVIIVPPSAPSFQPSVAPNPKSLQGNVSKKPP